MDTLPIEELKKIPHLNQDALPGQILCSTMFWVDGEWQFWLPAGNELFRVQALPAESAYFGTSAHHADDKFLGFLNSNATVRLGVGFLPAFEEWELQSDPNGHAIVLVLNIRPAPPGHVA
jgi:hypothetical protein